MVLSLRTSFVPSSLYFVLSNCRCRRITQGTVMWTGLAKLQTLLQTSFAINAVLPFAVRRKHLMVHIEEEEGRQCLKRRKLLRKLVERICLIPPTQWPIVVRWPRVSPFAFFYSLTDRLFAFIDVQRYVYVCLSHILCSLTGRLACLDTLTLLYGIFLHCWLIGRIFSRVWLFLSLLHGIFLHRWLTGRIFSHVWILLLFLHGIFFSHRWLTR